MTDRNPDRPCIPLRDPDGQERSQERGIDLSHDKSREEGIPISPLIVEAASPETRAGSWCSMDKVDTTVRRSAIGCR